MLISDCHGHDIAYQCWNVRIDPLSGHMLLHEGRFDMTSQRKEIEGEATAFIVCENFEIETNAPNYLAHWSSPEQIKESGLKNYQVRQQDH